MRLLLVCLVALAAVAATPAHAKKGKKKAKQKPLAVVVLPTDAEGKAGVDLKDALELELSTLDEVLVEDSIGLEADLQRAGARAFEAKALAGLLAKRKIDVVVRSAKEGRSTLHVAAYAADGQPRFHAAVDAQGDADGTAGRVLAGLKPALSGWRGRKAVAVPPPLGGTDDDPLAPERRDAAPKERVDDRALVIDPDTLETGDAKRPDDEPVARAGPERDDPVDDAPKASRRALVDAPADGDDRRGDERLAQADAPRQRMADVVDDASEPSPPRATHLFSFGAAADGSTWQYWFFGADPAQDVHRAANAFAGASGHVDFWPIPWAGVDASGSVAPVPFRIDQSPQLEIRPDEFVSWRWSFAAHANGRLLLGPDVGLGARLGYRLWWATVEPQTLAQDVGVNLTLVPGYQMHALSVGGSFFLPLRVADKKLELELLADVLPLTRYVEIPDNPGGSTRAFGWSVAASGRYDVWSGFFVELRGTTTGAFIEFAGEGDRVTPRVDRQTGERIPFGGGQTLNMEAGLSLGAGWMF